MLYRTFAALATAIFLSVSSAAIAAPPMGMPALPPQPKVHPAGIPANYMMVSPCIAGMGEHWADLKTGPHATTIFGTYQGKPVFTEIMLLPADFAAGKSYENVLRPLAGYQIDHVDIQYLKHGHPGMAYAHYDLHAYYVTPAVQHKICANGLPVPL